ncbi:MAG TPA: ABC transporter permease subunit [Mycobacteriales bacterium]|nr:ABC transporter permease subunit [Mycobacteriales bacterium]
MTAPEIGLRGLATDVQLPSPPRSRSRARARAQLRSGVSRHVILIIAALYLLLPLYAGVKFALTSDTHHFSFEGFRSIPRQPGFGDAFKLSLKLALVTTIITLVLMVPTAVFVHLRLPKLRRLLDGLTILPIVIPPVVLIVGVLQVAPTKLKGTPYLLALEYVVLAMPFAYRSLDAGLRSFDLRTMVDASRSLGGGWLSTLWSVLLPNLRAAVMSATVLTVALVLGEYTMATLDQYTTFPVWIVTSDQYAAQTSVGASILALVVTWGILLVISVLGGRRRGRRNREETG